MRELTRRLQELDEDYQKHKADSIKNFQNIYDQLLTKASLEQLADLDTKVQEKLSELFQALLNKFTDKHEARNQFKQIETTLKALYDMIMALQPNSPKDNEDDAMFVKKPLGGFSCASCEKSLNNL